MNWFYNQDGVCLLRGRNWIPTILFNFRLITVVSHRFFTAKTRLRYQVCSCESFGGQIGTGTCFSPSISDFSCQYHSTNYTTFIISYIFLLREGQMGQVWEPSQNECFFKNMEALDRNILSLFFNVNNCCKQCYRSRNRGDNAIGWARLRLFVPG